MRTRLTAGMITLAFLGAAQSQDIHKYIYPDGRVVYADKPVPGARLVETFERAAQPDPAAVEAAQKKRLENARALSEAASTRQRSLDQAESDLKVWTTKLEEARAQLEAGREPLPGERTGVVYQGRSRLSEAYWARQRENEAAVAEAQAHIDHARTTIQSLR